jgi:hypothetical protein
MTPSPEPSRHSMPPLTAAHEKDDEGMALKILTRTEDMPDGEDDLDWHAYTHWKRAPLFVTEPAGG